MEERAPIALVVFDFDGTLCDSADIKTDAFHALYLDEEGPEFADAVLEYHLANAGSPRFDKIRHIEREMLGRDPSPERVEQVADRFAGIVEVAVMQAPLFEGVLDFLDAHHGRLPMAIASATPTDELRRIAGQKGIAGYFEAIEGSPTAKSSILAELVDRYGIAPDRAIMVGDQPSDARAAREAGTRGLMIAHAAPWIEPFDRADSFVDAARVLDTLIAD